MRRVLFLMLCALPGLLVSQYRLEVEAMDVESSEGSVLVAVYNVASSFLDIDKVYRTAGAAATQGMTRVVIEDLPAGEYALAIFHDENGNDELDTNWIGIPKEPVGFSVARMKTFGPPKFKDCIVLVNEDKVIQIPLE